MFSFHQVIACIPSIVVDCWWLSKKKGGCRGGLEATSDGWLVFEASSRWVFTEKAHSGSSLMVRALISGQVLVATR